METVSMTIQQYAQQISTMLYKAGMGEKEISETLAEMDMAAYKSIANERYPLLSSEEQEALDTIDSNHRYTKKELAGFLGLAEDSFDELYLEKIDGYTDYLDELGDNLKELQKLFNKELS